ncbi:MAG: ribosome maturation factor RimP [Bacteroidia bacterium]
MVDLNYIKQLIENKLAGTEQFLVDAKISPDKLTIYIDKPAGITIEECSAFSRYLVNELEPHSFLEKHEIEVSSPGLDKPLKVFNQYLQKVGKVVNVITADGKSHKGKLITAGSDGFELLEIIEDKKKNKKIINEKNLMLSYNEVKETKVEISF